MRALVIYCHPNPSSFTAAVRDVVLEKLSICGAEFRVHDLYAQNFQPVLTKDEWTGYLDCANNCDPVEEQVRDVAWCDTLIFVYPTWWYGLPAMLKGWLDRVLLPGVAFIMPQADGENIKPGLAHISKMGVFTTCGASWWLTRIIGAPGKRTLLRGVGFLLSPKARKVFAAHFQMDSAKPVELEAHLRKVASKMDRLIGQKQAAPLENVAVQ